jgi:hypothetical protein
MKISSTGAVVVSVTLALLPGAARPSADDMKDCPMHAQHQAAPARSYHRERGDEGMGFSQGKTTHHFLLSRDGGSIQVTANAPDDHATVEQVRGHLADIAKAFGAGDFATPVFVHEQTPPGVLAMKRLKSRISYVYEERPDGAAVVIRSQNPEAIAAVQEFLQFQIREHQTGDPVR